MALHRVEVLGPSGVGKSTILKTMRRHQESVSGATWLFPEDLVEPLKSLREGTTAGQRLRRAVDEKLPDAFTRTCFKILGESAMCASQKFSAAAILRRSCEDFHDISSIEDRGFLIHDELLLHRAFSLLPGSHDLERDASEFFSTVPTPPHALILKADAEVILQRVMSRRSLPNCYRFLDHGKLIEEIQRLLTAGDIAEDILRRRGVGVHVIDANGPVEEVGRRIIGLLSTFRSHAKPASAELMQRLLGVSGSFRKKNGRHELKSQGLAYCSFHTAELSIPVELAQRNAGRRLARFDLVRSQVESRSVLDLGCNSGAMLFQLSNLGIKSGLGIEYDQDKVDLARDIAELSELRHLEFRQADIDRLDVAGLGKFDIVLALAVEAHVMEPDKLLQLLADVTRGTLYFEGNGGCDIRAIAKKLLELGFAGVEQLGVCDDDARPSNNNRPLLKAWKAASLVTSTSSEGASRAELNIESYGPLGMDREIASSFPKLRFARGFYLGTRRWSAAPDHWRQRPFAGGWLAVDARVPLQVAASPSMQVALIGRAYDLEARTSDGGLLVRALAEARLHSPEAMQGVVDRLSGRFLIVDVVGGQVRVQQDAAGMRTAFYLNRDDDWLVASHAKLLAEVAGDLEPSVFGDYWASGANPLYGAYGYPGRATEFRDVYALTPNTVLSVRQGTLERIFPIGPAGNMGVEEAGDWIAAAIHDQLVDLADKDQLVMSLTSGLDSRVTLAAAGREVAKSAKFFTYSPATRQSDIDVAVEIAREHGLDHQLFDLSEFRDFPSEFPTALRMNSPRRHVHSAAFAYLQRFNQGDLHVRSNHYEIGRAFYLKHRPRKISRSLETLAKRLMEKGGEPSPATVAAFEDWAGATGFPMDSEYLPQDLFYWEHRMSRWCAPNLCESDVAFDTWAVVNSRNIYKVMLAVNFDDRVDGSPYHHIIRSRWPGLLKQPINGVMVKG